MKHKKLFPIYAIAFALILAGCGNLGNDLSPFGTKTTGMTSKTADQNLISGAQAITPLLASSSFAVLAGTTVTNDGASVISGNLGVSPGTAITGFQSAPLNNIMGPGTVTAGLGIVNGTIYAAGPVAAQAHNDAVTAYNNLVAQVPGTTFPGVSQLNGLTFTPGVYSFAPSANLQVNGTVYLDFQGNNDALFIFQVGTTLVTMAGSKVIALNNNSTACSGSNVYWAVGSSATIDGAQFIGNVIATTTITMTTDASVSGRIWAINGAVTMINDAISVCGSGGVTVPPKTCRDFVTGGGWIQGSNGEKATFGVSGGIKNEKFWGQLSFNDHKKDGVKIKSTSITAYILIDAVTRQIEGIANVNGQGSFAYTVVVVDNGEPGTNDGFSLTLSNGYRMSGTLQGGNIHLHKKCGESGTKDDDDHNKDENDGNKSCDSDHEQTVNEHSQGSGH